MENLICSPVSPLYLIISQNVPAIVYYSHFLAILSSIILIFYIVKSNANKITKQIFSATFISFLFWIIFALIFWASNRGDVIMLVWSLTLLVEPLTYIGAFYLLYLLVEKQDLSYKNKILLSILYLPLIVFVPTKYGLSGFDTSTCLSIEGPLALYYTYFVEIVIIMTIIIYSIHRIIKRRDHKWEITNLSIGTILFLFAFAWGNIIGSFTEDWQLAQYGLFGMPIFAGFLVYSIVRFKTFNIKLLGTQALVVSLWILLAVVLFLRTIENVRIVISLTLILFLIIGIFLVRSVKREVEQREKIQRLADDLQSANDKLKELDQLKSEFLSLATHQIRAPLTAIKGYSSMLLEGDFGVLPPKAANSVEIVMKSCQNLINIVNDFLNISRIEQGRMVYEKSIFDIGALVNEVANEIKPNVQSAGLELQVNIKSAKQEVNADRNKIKQAISNLVDNSIKYTVKGGILIAVFTEGNKVKVAIKDTGVGIDPQEMGKLFAKFSRTKDANKTNVVGTGLGLYIAKKMVEAHQGDIKVDSDGLGKGTTFTIELPKYS